MICFLVYIFLIYINISTIHIKFNVLWLLSDLNLYVNFTNAVVMAVPLFDSVWLGHCSCLVVLLTHYIWMVRLCPSKKKTCFIFNLKLVLKSGTFYKATCALGPHGLP